MQRYFVAKEQFTGDSVRIIDDDAHHLLKVMRSEPGDKLIVSNGEDREALVKITELRKEVVTARIVEELEMNNEPAVDVWVAQSLPKGDKLETVIQKCTELGAVRFIPFLSERTVVQYDERKEAKRLDRWRKIAKEAAEQAHRNRIPQVDAPIRWKQLLQLAAEAEPALLCYEKESGQHIRQALTRARSEQAALQSEPAVPGRKPILMLIVGPEGGFAEREVLEAEAAGCLSIGLGSRILRTETAAMVGVTCILYEYEEMGGSAPCRQ